MTLKVLLTQSSWEKYLVSNYPFKKVEFLTETLDGCSCANGLFYPLNRLKIVVMISKGISLQEINILNGHTINIKSM